MKKKNASVDSIEIITGVNNGAIETEVFKIKAGNTTQVPLDPKIVQQRAVLLCHEVTIKSLKHLYGMSKEELAKDSHTRRGIKSLLSVVRMKNSIDIMEFHLAIYKLYPKLQGHPLAFDDSISSMRILGADCENPCTIKDIEKDIQDAMALIKPDMGGKRGKYYAEAVEQLDKVDIPQSTKMEYAEIIADAQVVYDKVENLDAKEVTKKDIDIMKKGKKIQEQLLSLLGAKGGIA